MKAKTILLTGGSGFLGKHLLEHFKNYNFKITTGTRSIEQSKKNGFVYLNIENKDSIMSLKNYKSFDCIVHLAAKVDFMSETDQSLHAANVQSVECLVELAKIWKSQLIFTSSALIAGTKSEYVSSNTPDDPDVPYTRTKMLAEKIIKDSQISYCILRVAGIFGNNGPAHLGINNAIDKAIKGIGPIQYGSGLAKRNYIYVNDVAKAIIYAINNRLTGTHITSGSDSISIASMMEFICNALCPNETVTVNTGIEASSQVFKSSELLPKTLCFSDALIDIKNSLK
jgi:nucleoside-diphosphate-sugar epimerase